MISSINNHQKHAGLARLATGEWNRNELAIIGTDCNTIRQLMYAVTEQLSSYKIGYADADHAGDNADGQSTSTIHHRAYAEYVNKISFTQFNIHAQLSSFQTRILLNDCDLVLVNGNHHAANKQIIVIDEARSLEKKLAKLTSVQLILLKKSSSIIPEFIRNQVPDLSSIPVLHLDEYEAISNHIRKILQQQMPAINGLVLCGGQSTRMGRDKGNLQYHDKSQQAHVFELLSRFCNETFISCNRHQAKAITDLPFIEDAFLGLGPTGGILSAFQRNPNAAWLVVACDLPYLDTHTIQYLVHHRNASKMATAFFDKEEKFPEPLVTIWEPKAYPFLMQLVSMGYSCPRKALLNSDIALLRAPDASAFTNINTPDEYKEARLSINDKI